MNFLFNNIKFYDRVEDRYVAHSLDNAIGKPSVGAFWRGSKIDSVEAIAHGYPPVYEPSMQDIARKG